MCLQGYCRAAGTEITAHLNTVTTPTPAHWAQGSKRSLKLVVEQEEAAAAASLRQTQMGSELMPARKETFTNSSPRFLLGSHQRGRCTFDWGQRH